MTQRTKIRWRILAAVLCAVLQGLLLWSAYRAGVSAGASRVWDALELDRFNRIEVVKEIEI